MSERENILIRILKRLGVITDDERFQKDMEMWGDNCDKIDWQIFYRRLERFRAGRK